VGRRANRSWARQIVVDVVPSTMSGMVFEARNEWFNHRVSILYHFLLLLCAELFNDGVACNTKQHWHSCILACTTPNSSSGQEEKGRSTSCF